MRLFFLGRNLNTLRRKPASVFNNEMPLDTRILQGRCAVIHLCLWMSDCIRVSEPGVIGGKERANGPAPASGLWVHREGWRWEDKIPGINPIYFTVWWGLIQPFSALLQRYRLNLLKNKKIHFIPSSSFGGLMPWKAAFY